MDMAILFFYLMYVFILLIGVGLEVSFGSEVKGWRITGMVLAIVSCLCFMADTVLIVYFANK